MNDAYGKALDQLRSYGLLVDAIVADGRFHYVKVEGNKGGKKSGWYICSEIRLKNSYIALTGAFGNYRLSDEKQTIKLDAEDLTPQEKSQLTAARKELEQASLAEREKLHARAKKLGAQIWHWGSEQRASKYLWRKKVAAFGVRVDRRGTLLVPVKNFDGDLVGLQFIPEDGQNKKFLTGTPKQGSFHLIGDKLGREPLVFAEGYATAASVHMGCKWPVFVCFDAGNLLAVAKAARERFPDRAFVIAGDDDHESAENTGRQKAMAAARAVGAHLAFPVFKRGKGKSDFNDLMLDEGIERVGELLRDAVAREPIGGDAPVAPAPLGDGGVFDFSLGALLDRYTLVYGTTTVYDAIECKLIELTALRVASTPKVTNRWLKHPERKVVSTDDVVFDPTGAALPHQVNLFRGMPMVPKAGECGLILELLHYLCGESEASFDWVLKWIAYPLQHVGAKMQTAIAMHGPEGTGKNLLWGVVASLYGRYATSINQNQLEGKFNGWASAKLFIVGNEVVSRAELYHAKGGVKTMITEPKHQIEEKHLPVREERNFTNLVFLSNVLQPVAPDPDDRHYMILWTPPARDAEWYRDIAKQIESGGREAFYDYLLKLDLGDFNEHTKPIMTSAKANLIELSMDTPERFWRQWSAGELRWAYSPLPSMEVYGAYKAWCEPRGERALREAVFIAQLHKRMMKVKKTYFESNRQSMCQRWFLIPREWRVQQGKTEQECLAEALSFFRGANEQAKNVQ